MKNFNKNNTSTWFTAISLLVIALAFSSNPPLGKTGAPGEGLCSDCHSGGNFTGTTVLRNLPDTVIANKKYTFMLSAKSVGPLAGGFEMLCIDRNNVSKGVFTSGLVASVRNDGSKQYIAHTQPKDFAKDTVAWTIDWQAPATGVGDTLNFYYAVNLVNKKDGNSGDNPVKGKKKVYIKSAVAVQDISSLSRISLNRYHDELEVTGHQVGTILNILSLNGQLIKSLKLVKDQEFIKLDAFYTQVYLFNFNYQGEGLTKKICLTEL